MKLTTKLGLIFLMVVTIIGIGLGFFGIPSVKRYLEDREVNYSKSFLMRETQNTRLQLIRLKSQVGNNEISEDQLDLKVDELFKRNKQTFNTFFFHKSGRMFVFDDTGTIWQSSDPTKHGISVSNLWIYDDNQRDKLIREINVRQKISDQILQLEVQEFNQGKGRTDKILFVSSLPGIGKTTRFFICISENKEDIYYTAHWVSRSLIYVLAITILVFYFFFQIFYTRLRKRYDRIVEHANMVAAGNYSLPINDDARDEIGMLASTIDKLASRLDHEKDFADHHVQGQKMEMIGTLASGIAHDFNNMLGSILSGLDLVNRELSMPADGHSPDIVQIKNTVRVAHACAERGKKTVEELLSFSKKRRANILPLDLNHVMGSVKEICKHSFDRRIKIESSGLDEAAVVEADRGLLEQAILNVCINARDAMKSDGGILTFGLAKGARSTPRGEGEVTQNYFVFTIEDNGSGMNEETQERVFEPFYTSKEQGIGLGLAMVYKTIDDLEGFVEIKSEIGMGTKFSIFLPASDKVLPEDQQIPHRPESSMYDTSKTKMGVEKVLIIDDDEFMLQITEDILSRLGYEPFAVANGKNGIETFEKLKDKVAIVILDLMLPDMGGDEVFDKLRDINPDIKILLVSGFKRDPRIADMLIRGCNGFLKKPYSIEELSQAIRDIIDEQDEVLTC